MSKPIVVISRSWPKQVEEKMQALFDVKLNENDVPMTAGDMQDALKSADAFCPTVSDQVDAEVLSVDTRRSGIIASYGVGFNHIDLDAARKAGLTVTNTPEVLTDCTADLAMALMLTPARRVGEGERHLRNGEWTGWRPTHMMGTSVTGKTLGLIGMGRIAQAVAKRAANGFNMKIIFHDPFLPEDAALDGIQATRCDSPEQVFSQADFVSLHCPGGKDTYHLISDQAFDAMQSHAIVINTARGDVIDEAALVRALHSGKIAGAGLDVFEHEPTVSPELLAMENVVLLPHLGSASIETRVAMGMRVVDNLTAFFNGETPRDKLV